MKLFVLAAIFSTAVVFAAAAPAEDAFHQEVQKREEEALKQCNVTNPVPENTRVKLGLMVIKGETIPKQFNSADWCNLYCNLEKLGFFDSQGKMQVRKIFKFVLKSLPEISPNSHTLLVHLFQIYRSTKDMEDKCSKAFVTYHRFAEAVFVSSVAVDLNAQTDVREKIVESVLTGEELPKEFQNSVEKYLKNVDFFVKQVTAQSAAPAPAPAPDQAPSS